MAKQSITLDAVPETLLIPLYGRAVETRKKRPLLSDPKAVEMVNAIDYDFGKFDGSRSLFGSVVRTAVFDSWVREFLRANPGGTVIEAGCGLNTRFERLDNGRLSWFDSDLPDAIELRRRFFTDSERRKMLAASVTDDSWVAPVKATGGPWFFAIEAVLPYLPPEDVRQALSIIGKNFPGAHIAFDTTGAYMVKQQARQDIFQGLRAPFLWTCDEPNEVEQWDVGLRRLENTHPGGSTG